MRGRDKDTLGPAGTGAGLLIPEGLTVPQTVRQNWRTPDGWYTSSGEPGGQTLIQYVLKESQDGDDWCRCSLSLR